MQRKLFDIYAGKMMAVCRRYTKTNAEAEDMLQEGFIKVFTKIGQHENGSFEGWLRKIFVNTCLNNWRKRAIHSGWIDVESSTAADTAEDGLQKLQAEELLNMIGKLPEGARLIFNLYAIEGLPHTEIAVLLNITESACRAQLSRARKLLQAQLKTHS